MIGYICQIPITKDDFLTKLKAAQDEIPGILDSLQDAYTLDADDISEIKRALQDDFPADELAKMEGKFGNIDPGDLDKARCGYNVSLDVQLVAKLKRLQIKLKEMRLSKLLHFNDSIYRQDPVTKDDFITEVEEMKNKIPGILDSLQDAYTLDADDISEIKRALQDDFPADELDKITDDFGNIDAADLADPAKRAESLKLRLTYNLSKLSSQLKKNVDACRLQKINKDITAAVTEVSPQSITADSYVKYIKWCLPQCSRAACQHLICEHLVSEYRNMVPQDKIMSAKIGIPSDFFRMSFTINQDDSNNILINLKTDLNKPIEIKARLTDDMSQPLELIGYVDNVDITISLQVTKPPESNPQSLNIIDISSGNKTLTFDLEKSKCSFDLHNKLIDEAGFSSEGLSPSDNDE